MDGIDAGQFSATIDNTSQPVYLYYRYIMVRKNDKWYTLSWYIMTPTNRERDDLVAQYGADVDEIIASFRFK